MRLNSNCRRVAGHEYVPSRGRTRQAVGFRILFSRNVRNGKIQRARQFAADPIQGIKTRAAAGVFAAHLLDDDFRIREDVECPRADLDSALQGFKQREVFGYVVVLVTDPFLDSDRTVLATIDYHANAGWPGIPQRPSINIGDKIRHFRTSF